jgi:hypothetical protein
MPRGNAISESVRYLLDQQTLVRAPARLAATSDVDFFSRQGTFLYVVIAAVNTSPELQLFADYICTGTNDQDTIAMALDELNITQDDLIGEKGGIIFLSGDYQFDDYLVIGLEAFGKLEFLGHGTPVFHLNHNTIFNGTAAPMFLVEGSLNASVTQLIFRNIHFHGENQSNGSTFVEWTTQIKPLIIVEDCVFSEWDEHIWWSERQVQRIIRSCRFLHCTLSSVFLMQQFANASVIVSANIWSDCSGNFMAGGPINGQVLFDGNVQDDPGSIVLNVVALVTYGTNPGF